MEEEHPNEEGQAAPEPQLEKETTLVSASKEMSAGGDLEEVDGNAAANGEEGESSPENEPGSPLSRGNTRLLAIGIVAVVVLIIVGLLLPPVSLGERLGLGGDEDSLTAEEVSPADETESATAEGDAFAVSVAGDVRVRSKTVSRQEFLNGEADDDLGPASTTIAGNRSLVSDVYLLDYKDEAPMGTVSFAVPTAAQPYQTVDVMGWDGQAWTMIPSEVDDAGNHLTSLTGPLPGAVALMQSSAPAELEIGAEVLPLQELPPSILPYLSEVMAGTLTLVQQGKLVGDVVEIPTSGYRQYLRVTNTGAIVDVQSLTNLLTDPASRAANIQELVNQASTGGFNGVNLDYQGVSADQREAFTGFVAELSAALDASNMGLIVTLETPVMVSGEWDTAGQDWAAIGQIADAVYLQMPLDPTAYGDDGQAAQIAEWAVRHVDRYKLSLLVTVNAIDAVADSPREVGSDQALSNFGELTFVAGGSEIEPGEQVEVALSGSASDLQWDPDSQTYKYTYEEANQSHNVWLGSEAQLTRRSRFADQLNTRGVAVRGLGALDGGEGYAAALASLLEGGETPAPTSAAIVWAVEDDSGGIVASSSGEAPTFSWTGSDAPGSYTIRADFAHGDAIASLGELEVVVQEQATPTPTPEPEEEVVEATATPETAASEVVINPGDADAAVNTAANVRNGPGLAYGIIGGAQQGEKVSLIGRNQDSTWYQVRLSDGAEGWIFGRLLSVNPSISTSQLAVVEVEPPAASSGGGAPVAVAPVASGSFELGGQAFGAPYGQMQFAGMSWIKRQHKWGPGNTGQEVAGLITEAHNAGFKILLSIPGPPYPSGINFSEYVGFLGRVAALPDPPDAIEIWNEQNIDREWPAGQISPQAYVQNMLAPAYQAIKGANSRVMVISGAPAPTGAFGGGCSASGCDDAAYVAGMAAAGAASYMDCIGIHYNEGIISPTQTSGDPRGNSSHYTRYFWGMVNAYYNAFGGSRQLCFTELGYLTPEGYGGLPGGFSWAGNVTVAQQAQWLAEATSLAANSGKVRMLIVWNVDSTTWGNDPQAGYAIIRKDGSCPACGTLNQVMGG
ncbi:MAG: SH3 domain-containing protein [Chloroflexota bacterium]|jgi:SH3-like domain-containing protein